jgi:succinate dehydrogenase/fumarate reductase cytochrome b subunit
MPDAPMNGRRFDIWRRPCVPFRGTMNASVKKKRPFGVTVLALLQIVSGFQMLGGALVVLGIAAIATTTEGQEALEAALSPWLAENAALILAVVGLALLTLAVWSFFLARGYLKGNERARRRGRRVALYAIAFAVLGIMLVPVRTDPGSPWLTVLFNLTIYLYLNSAKVRMYFKNQ